jgi:hypothetical protein
LLLAALEERMPKEKACERRKGARTLGTEHVSSVLTGELYFLLIMTDSRVISSCLLVNFCDTVINTYLKSRRNLKS